MSFIRVIGEDEAEGKLFEIYDRVQKSRGRLSNVLRIQSLHPAALDKHLELYMTLLFGKGPMSRQQREMIGVAVSSANECEYCVTHHSEALNKYAKDDSWVKGIADGADVKLEDADKAIIEFARGLTVAPGKGREAAVQKMRDAGFDDEAILHATELVAYFNFVNRLAGGLGVDLEEDGQRDYDY